MWKENCKNLNSNGITLIALVITIIVLLILAGVTIATLTGDNGILNQAGKAKDKTTEAESIERVQVEVVGSYGLDGTIDKDQLNKNLKNINGLTYNGNALSDSNKIANLPATVTLNGYDIVINANGGVEKIPEMIAKIRANPQAYYGKKVTNYKASDSDTNTYRIFYIDTAGDFGDANTIYLKADFSGSYSLSTSAISSANDMKDTSKTLVSIMNPDWWNNRKNETTFNVNEKAAAYLCSPVNADNYSTTKSLPWKGYFDSTAANYVIGGPSVEMYVKTYNQAYDGIITDNTKYPIGATYRATSAPGYIYTLNGAQSTISNSDYWTGTDSLNYTRYNSMYCGKTENGTAIRTGDWWLASPSAAYSDRVCRVGGDYACLTFGSYDNSSGVSPLVSLKSSFIPEVEE